MSSIIELPLVVVSELPDEFIKIAANYKASLKTSFADCFVLALAKIHNAKVITSDHHEFDAVEQSGEVKFEWIR